MKKITLILAAALFCVTFAANAQELSSAPGPVDSPQINPDGTVTFRFQDRKAVKVQVTGDFLPSQTVGRQEVQGVVDMVEGPNGVWEYTTEKLAPEFYGYKFIVDGVTIPDPANLVVCRDGSVLTTKFLIPGDRADLYAIHDVPHGTVAHVPPSASWRLTTSAMYLKPVRTLYTGTPKRLQMSVINSVVTMVLTTYLPLPSLPRSFQRLRM